MTDQALAEFLFFVVFPLLVVLMIVVVAAAIAIHREHDHTDDDQ